MKYQDIMEDIIEYQGKLMISFWNYNYADIDFYSKRIQVLINKILKDNSLLIENHN